MRTYKFEVTYEEVSDEFKEQLDKEALSGCDSITEFLRDFLGSDYEVTLVEYTNYE